MSVTSEYHMNTEYQTKKVGGLICSLRPGAIIVWYSDGSVSVFIDEHAKEWFEALVTEGDVMALFAKDYYPLQGNIHFV